MGKNLTIYVTGEERAASIKDYLAFRYNNPIWELEFYYSGIYLEESVKLNDLNLKEMDIIRC
jgi:hypothetical protein